jgi:hypothetical protein
MIRWSQTVLLTALFVTLSCSRGGWQDCIAEDANGSSRACVYQSFVLTQKTRYFVMLRDRNGKEIVRDLGQFDEALRHGSSSGVHFAEIALSPDGRQVGVALRRGGERVRYFCFVPAEGKVISAGCGFLWEKVRRKFQLAAGVVPLVWADSDDAVRQYANWEAGRTRQR